MADHFEEVVGLRLTALEGRAADEEKALKEYFVELQQFITSSLKAQTDTLRIEWRSELRSGLDGVRSELSGIRFDLNGIRSDLNGIHSELNGVHAELNSIKGDGRRLDQRLESLEQKLDAHHAVTQTVLQDILGRLPPPASSLGV